MNSNQQDKMNADYETCVIPLCQEICRRESSMKLTSFLDWIKSSKNHYFKGLVETLTDVHGKPDWQRTTRISIGRVLDRFDKGKNIDMIFMYLIEATFAADQANQNTKHYGYCLKILEEQLGHFKFRNEEHVKFWLARHKSIYYMCKYKSIHTEKMRTVADDMDGFYKASGNKPDMWTSFACQTLCKMHLYEQYQSKTSSAASCSSAKAMELLEDECRFAFYDPEHEMYPGNYDFFWPHIQKCLVLLRMPIGFHMRMWKRVFPNSNQMRYDDIPDHFKWFFGQEISQQDIVKCHCYFETLKKLSHCKNAAFDVDEDFLQRTMSMISIGLKVRKFNIASGECHLVLILYMMVDFMERFLVVKAFFLREYTYARPETIFPVFLSFITGILKNIENVAKSGLNLQRLLRRVFTPLHLDDHVAEFVKLKCIIDDACKMRFTEGNLKEFCRNLKSFIVVPQDWEDSDDSSVDDGLSDLDALVTKSSEESAI